MATIYGTNSAETIDATGGVTDDADTIIAYGGKDTIFGLGGNDFLKGGGGGDTIDGGAGIDTASYADSAIGVSVDLLNKTAAGGDAAGDTLISIENLMGSAFKDELKGDGTGNILIGLDGNDLLMGNGGQDSLYGWEGADDLDGGAGLDTMDGGAGSDDYFVDNAGDIVVEYAGKGTLDRVFASVDYALAAGVNVEWLETTNMAGTAALDLTGNELDNVLRGNAGANVLDGRGGADIMSGLAGNDWYIVDNKKDVVIDAVGQGTLDRVFTSTTFGLTAGAEIEVFSTTDHLGLAPLGLYGNELANAIYGNAGSNNINGNAGNDTLSGFGGADTFWFTADLDAANNVDTITDFDPEDDRFGLPHYTIFGDIGIGMTLDDELFCSGAFAAEADDRIIHNPITGELFYDADGTGATAAVKFAAIDPGVVLSNNEFYVF